MMPPVHIFSCACLQISTTNGNDVLHAQWSETEVVGKKVPLKSVSACLSSDVCIIFDVIIINSEEFSRKRV